MVNSKVVHGSRGKQTRMNNAHDVWMEETQSRWANRHSNIS